MDQLFEFVKNHWLLWVAFFGFLGLIAFDEARKNVHGMRRLKPQEVVRLLNDESAVLIDLRPQQAFHAGHILGSVNISLDTDSSVALKKIEVYQGKKIILLGKDDASVVTFGAKLQKSGVQDVSVLSGGLLSWKNASLPLAKKK